MVAPLLEGLFGDHMPVRFEFWDGSGLGPTDGPGTLVIRSPNAISRMLWAPGELGIGRAYVTGELEADGDIFGVLRALHDAARPDLKGGASAGNSGLAGRSPTGRPRPSSGPPGGRGLPPRPATLQKPRRRGDQPPLRHQQRVLPLDPGAEHDVLLRPLRRGVHHARSGPAVKHDLVCRKLGLHEHRGARLLDVGCGWGSMALHAARHYGATWSASR
jgi:cyclopropane-fatty-acyl-phospholipid synthase